jgi:antitoxin VapB
MPVVFKDPETERAIRALAAATNQTMTDAVREACEAKLEEIRARKPLRERLAELQRRAKEGTPDPDFDAKAFLDDAWGHQT